MSSSSDHSNPPETRAGRYVRQLTGYRAFLPTPLPPEPPIRLEGELYGLLSQADRALGRLDGSIQTLPNPDLFVFMYVRKEAVLSSQIEGTQSSLNDLREAHRALVTAHFGRAAGHGHRVLEHLFQRPFFQVNHVREWIGTSYPAANNLVSRLVEHGIVQEHTGNKRNRVFRYQPYIALFGENLPAEPARETTTEGIAK